MAVIGIDLGTTYSAVARCTNGVPEIIDLDGKPTLPSVVSLLKGGKIVIGYTAKKNQVAAPHNTIVEVKRKMGQDVEVPLGEKKFSPQEVSAMILTRIKQLAEEQLGEPITGAVISCPAYFKDPARMATEQAGELAGLKILRLINEPTAAAYAYGVRENQSAPEGNVASTTDESERLYIVYDLGGGTFDVTVIRMSGGLLEVIGTGGDPQLGGGNFDDCIVNWMLEKIGQKNPDYLASLTDERRAAVRLKLKVYAEEGKIKLCEAEGDNPSYQFQVATVDVFQGRPIIFNEKLTRSMFEDLIRELLNNSLKWIDEALKAPKEKYNYMESHLTAILLVGGSTRIPLVNKILEERFEKTKTPVWGRDKGINPDEIVAMGASILAADLDMDADSPATGAVLVDVTGHTLSVAAMNEQHQVRLQPIIMKESPIPCRGSHRFSSQGNFQGVCRIEVYQGEGVEINEQVTMIGAFDIKIEKIQNPIPLMVSLELNENGILVAHATNELSGQRVSCEMSYKGNTRISEKDLAEKRARLQKQLQEVIGQTANPLLEMTAAAAGAAPQRAAQPAYGGSNANPAPVSPAPSTFVDPTTLMNPIMRVLYQKALNSFSRVPNDRQNTLVEVVTAIEVAARSGDGPALNRYLPQLSGLLEGVE